ncbi:MAG: nonstructural protein [Arizlama microvirus]|nr:MAG: nonstructural protein [Arizlama microvirus]
MKYKIVSVRDRAADVFSVPNFVLNIGAAIRSFGDEIRKPGTDQVPNMFNKHPEDFDLYSLGEYDDETGEFSPTRPQQIAVGKDYA